MKLICTLSLALLCCASYGQKRSTKNLEDRKFLHQQLVKMLTLAHADDANVDTTDFSKYADEFTLNMEVLKQDYYTLRKDMDEGGATLALFFLEHVGRYFPQFQRFILTTTSIEGREVKITYFFFPDNSINYYNETLGTWVKKYHKPYFTPGKE